VFSYSAPFNHLKKKPHAVKEKRKIEDKQKTREEGRTGHYSARALFIPALN
jgi:hypothetical protein